jgi:hypothetical protein
MTKQQAVEVLKEIFGKRLLRIVSAANASWVEAQAAMVVLANGVNPADGATGTCTYTIDGPNGGTFTLVGVTQAECDGLPNSNFTRP